MSHPVDIESISQWNQVMEAAEAAGKTVIVDFKAAWCGPCKMIAPRFEALAAQNPHVQFVEVDVDDQPAIAQALQVSAMPTFFAIKDKAVVAMVRGADTQSLTRMIKQHGGPNPPVPTEKTAPAAAAEPQESEPAVAKA